jgi:hypothetical protein
MFLIDWFNDVARWAKAVIGPITPTTDEQLRYICEESGDVSKLQDLIQNSSIFSSSSVVYFPEGNRRNGYTPLTLAAR